MKLSGNRLRTSSGKILHFTSVEKRDNYERVAEAYKHGWKPKHPKSGSRHTSTWKGK